MTNINTSLNKGEDGTGLIQRSALQSLAGATLQITRAEHDDRVAKERVRIAGNSTGILAQGERWKIVGEEGERVWLLSTGLSTDAANAAASHARTVSLLRTLSITLGADANVALASTTLPTTGGADGDIRVNWIEGVVYLKASGAWTWPADGYSMGSAGQRGVSADIVIIDGQGDAEINRANARLVSRGEGSILLESDSDLTIGDAVTIDAVRVSMKCLNGHARLHASTLSAGKVALYLTGGDADSSNPYPLERLYSGFELIGNPALNNSVRDFNATGIRVNCDTELVSIRPRLDNVQIHGFQKGISHGNRAYLAHYDGLDVYGCKYGVFGEPSLVTFSENVQISRSALHNNDCHIYDTGGQTWRLFGTSLDYHGDAEDNNANTWRITTDDYCVYLSAGGKIESYGCHYEWRYGQRTGQTNAPFKLVGSNSEFRAWGGTMAYVGKIGGIQQYLYPAHFESNSPAQLILLHGVRPRNLGYVGDPTHPDALASSVGGAFAGANGARIIATALQTDSSLLPDMPSVLGYYPQAQAWRLDGANPFSEFQYRASVSGTAVLASASGVTSGVTPLEGSGGQMMRVYGQGVIRMALKNFGHTQRPAWSLFINGSSAVGTVTVREVYATGVERMNSQGNAIETAIDPRTNVSANTVTLTLGGTNAWGRVSWKDMVADGSPLTRWQNDFVDIEIDTTGLTSGSLFVDGLSYTPF